MNKIEFKLNDKHWGDIYIELTTDKIEELFIQFVNNIPKYEQESQEISGESLVTKLVKIIINGHLGDFCTILDNHIIDLNIKNKNNETLLIVAAAYNKPLIVKELIDRGARINELCNRGCDALRYAVMFKSIECVKLLKTAGGNIHTINNGGKSTIEYALSTKNLELIKALLN